MTGVTIGSTHLHWKTLPGGTLDAFGVDWGLTKIDNWFDGWEGSGGVDQKSQADGSWISPQYATSRVIHVDGTINAPSWDAATQAWDRFLSQVGVSEVFARLGSGPARRYDTTAVVLSAMFGLTLGESGSVEAIKHLGRADLGALAGIRIAPELATLRARLAAVADGCDPVVVQAALTRALIATAAPAEQVFFIDDHFVAYSGAAPVAKGWNTKRRHAQPGRDDTYICDLAGRALCFTSCEPSGCPVSDPFARAGGGPQHSGENWSAGRGQARKLHSLRYVLSRAL